MNYDIDFETKRTSIIDFLKNTEEFKDYEFTGSALSTLIDALAYVSVGMNTYANFALNESFLDTAQGRKAVVSKAKALGYVPYQMSCAKVKLRLYYKGVGSPNVDVIPIGTSFVGSKDDNSRYVFETVNAYSEFDLDEENGWFIDVEAVEGSDYTETWTQDEYGTTKFIIENTNIDISNMKVTVNSETYKNIESSDDIGKKMKSYYYIENASGNIELVFGDGVIAKKLSNKDTVSCTVRTCSGAKANNITKFSIMSFSGANRSDWTVETVRDISIESNEEVFGSHGGSDRETIESIKSQAQIMHQRQNRNVTANDYKAAITSKYGGILSGVACWGGEDNDPPMYGKIMISIQPKYADYASTSFAKEVTEFLKEKSVVSITPEYVAPDIIYVKAVSDCYYYNKDFTDSKSELSSTIENIIKNYFSDSINVFESNVYYSELISQLTAIGSYIRSIDVNFTLSKRIKVYNNNTETTYKIDFKNPIKEGSVSIEKWQQIGLVSGYGRIVDDRNGNLQFYRVVYKTENGKSTETLTLLNSNIGTVDYNTGIVNIDNFAFYLNGTNYVTMKCEPKTPSICTNRNSMFSTPEVIVNLTGV